MRLSAVGRIGPALLGLLPLAALAQDAVPTVERLWQIVQAQQAEIDALKSQLAATDRQVEATEQQLAVTADRVSATGDFVESLELPAVADTTIGGYGELHYNRLRADDPDNDLSEIDFHRFVLFVGHRFSDRIRFFSELEVEHSLAGDGQPGEVELEQAYVDFSLGDKLSAQAGLFLVPAGIINETHEPPTFYGVERNDVEGILIPATWWEAGAKVAGRFDSGLSWDFAVHSGLEMPTAGGSAFRVRSGRQKVAEALAADPAYTLRVRYAGVAGLELGASYQYQSDPSQIAGDGLDSGSLLTGHAIYQIGDFALRGLYSQWNFQGAAVEAAGADRQTGWYLEPSYKLNARWGVFARYSDVEGAREVDRFDQWEAGINYWPSEDVVVKFDYRSRAHDSLALAGEDFDGVDLGVGYQF